LIVHHLFCDAFSLTILLDDLQHAYLQRLNRSQLRLPAVGTPYPAWVRSLRNYANSEAGERCARQWLALHWSDVQPLPRELPGGPVDNTNAAARAVQVEWSLDETTKLLGHPRFTAQEILLAALHSTLANWMKSQTVLIDLLQHGRDPVESEMDLSRTVGMFIGYAPALLTSDPRDPKTHLQQIVDQFGDLPHLPSSLDVFRHLSDPDRVAARCKALPYSEVLFQFRGQPIGGSQEAFLTIVPNRSEGDHSPSGRRGHLLSVVFDVVDGRGKGTMVYCNRYHQKETIEDLCHQVRDRVSILIEI
jgi:hypothetical protein